MEKHHSKNGYIININDNFPVRKLLVYQRVNPISSHDSSLLTHCYSPLKLTIKSSFIVVKSPFSYGFPMVYHHKSMLFPTGSHRRPQRPQRPPKAPTLWSSMASIRAFFTGGEARGDLGLLSSDIYIYMYNTYITYMYIYIWIDNYIPISIYYIYMCIYICVCKYIYISHNKYIPGPLFTA